MNEELDIFDSPQPPVVTVSQPETVVYELLQYPANGDALAVADDLAAHVARLDNPHQTTTTQLTDLESLVLVFENNLI